MESDFSELGALEADLRSAPSEVVPFVKKALKRSGVMLKQEWQSRARVSRGSGYSEAYYSSIDFDERDTAAGPEVEVGPNLGKAGGSAGFLEEGGGKVTASPLHAGRDAKEATEPDFQRGLEAAIVEGTLKALGL